MELLINYFVEYQKIDPSLKGFAPHVIFLPLISSQESNNLFQQFIQSNNNLSAIIQSEDAYQITYHVHQNQFQYEFLVGSYTLMLNLCEKKNNYEEFVNKKKKIKHLLTEYSIFILLVTDQSKQLLIQNQDFVENEAVQLASEFDIRFEKTIGIIQSTFFNSITSHKIMFYQFKSEDKIKKIDELMLHRLKFKLNNIFRGVERGYQEFLQIEKEYSQTKKLLVNQIVRQAEMYRIIVNNSQNISASLDGEYVNIGNQYQGLTLKGMIFQMFNTHFEDIKNRYQDVIERISLNHIKRSMLNNESFQLQGFLSKNQFCFAFNDVIIFLRENASLILNYAYEVVIQGTLKSFKVGLRKFNCAEKIITVIREFMIGLKEQCSSLIEELVETLIVEIYFNFDLSYFNNLSINDDSFLSQVKKIGTDYYREVIQQVESTMAKLFFSKFVSKIQNNLQRTVMDSISFNMDIDFELSQKYVDDLNNNYTENMYFLKMYRIMTNNHVCQMYLSKNQEVQESQEEQIQIEPTQPKKKQTIKDKIKKFFNRLKKEEKVSKDQQHFRRRVDFQQAQRARSPDSSIRISQTQLQKASLASEFMLNQNTIDSQVEKPLTVLEWLKITGNDELYRILPIQKLKVSLARGIPSGIRSSIWAQMTRVELIKHPLIKSHDGYIKLRDSYSLLKSQNSPSKNQIDIDVKRTEQRFPAPDRKIYAQMLANLLTAYSNWDPVVGYTQGMNFICVMLLLVYTGHLKNEEFCKSSFFYLLAKYTEKVWQNKEEIEKNAFLTMIMIMKCKHWDEVLGPQMPKLVILLDQFNQMFKKQFPQLELQLEQTGFTSQIIVTHHIISILTSESPYLFSIRILDLFLLIGSEVVMETLRFMFMTCQASILRIQEPNEYFMFVRNLIAWEVFKICQDELEKFYL